jgi:stage V sporulation protein SpoVS
VKKYFFALIYFFIFSNIVVPDVVQVAGSGINIKTMPAQAAVYIDGAKRGITPFKMPQLKSGAHTIKITKDFYADYFLKVIVPENGCLEIRIDLEKETSQKDIVEQNTIEQDIVEHDAINQTEEIIE